MRPRREAGLPRLDRAVVVGVVAEPGAAAVTVVPSVSRIAIVESGPLPWPIALIAMTAMPREAAIDDCETQAFLFPAEPCAQISTGQPAAGRGPLGSQTVTPTSTAPVGASVPVRVAIGAMWPDGCLVNRAP